MKATIEKSPIEVKLKALLKILFAYIEQNPGAEITVFSVNNRPLRFIYFDKAKQRRICGAEQYFQLSKLN
jgi:hypothetical protein